MKEELSQIRFYADDETKNTTTYDVLSTGYSLSHFNKIKDFNIRTLPGTLINFYYTVNDSLTEKTTSVLVDHSGVYNLSCDGLSLNSFNIDSKSLDIIRMTTYGFFIATISHT